MDQMNAITAARIAPPFTEWRLYDPARQQMMKAQLQRILVPGRQTKLQYLRNLHKVSRLGGRRQRNVRAACIHVGRRAWSGRGSFIRVSTSRVDINCHRKRPAEGGISFCVGLHVYMDGQMNATSSHKQSGAYFVDRM
jgi:hypothetical protein